MREHGPCGLADAQHTDPFRALISAIISQQLLKSEGGAGRVAAYEVLVSSSALAAMIREGKTVQIPSLMQAGQSVGMQTMDMALERLLQKGEVSFEDALEKAIDKESFTRVNAAAKRR